MTKHLEMAAALNTSSGEVQGSPAVLDLSELGSEKEAVLRENRQWAEAVLAGEKRVLEMIARSSSLCSILEALCRLVEQISPDSLCSISLLDINGVHLCRGAAP